MAGRHGRKGEVLLQEGGMVLGSVEHRAIKQLLVSMGVLTTLQRVAQVPQGGLQMLTSEGVVVGDAADAGVVVGGPPFTDVRGLSEIE